MDPLTQEELQFYVDLGNPALPGPGSFFSQDPAAARAALIAAAQSYGTQFEYVLDYYAQGASPGLATAGLRAQGIQATTAGQRYAQNYQPPSAIQQIGGSGDCGCNGQSAPMPSRTTQLYPACRVPKMFTYTHQRVKGYHNVYFGNTLQGRFTRKSSANAFCRSMNEAIKHLGSAAEFNIADMSASFAALLAGGSGQWGLQNGFDPPMHGR